MTLTTSSPPSSRGINWQ